MKKDPFAALKHKDFFLLWTGLVTSNMGTWFQRVALGWIVLQMSSSPVTFGLLALCSAAPRIVLPLFGGVIADRLNKKKLLYFTQLTATLLATLLGILALTNRLAIWHILLIEFLSAAVNSLDGPTRQSFMPSLVPRKHLMNAIALNSTSWTLTVVLGPAVAGILISIIGTTPMFFINALSFFAMVAAVKLMKANGESAHKKTKFFDELQEGVRHIIAKKELLWLLLILASFAFVGKAAQQLFPIFAGIIWKNTINGYGLLLAASGAGSLAGGAFVAYTGQMKKPGIFIISCGLLGSASLAAFSLSPTIIIGAIFIFLNGFFIQCIGVTISTLLQKSATDAIRGRVMSFFSVAWGGVPQLGSFAASMLAEALGGYSGAPLAMLMGTGLLVAVTLLSVPYLRREPRLQHR